MKTIEKNGKTYRQDEVFVDLRKLTKYQMKSIPKKVNPNILYSKTLLALSLGSVKQQNEFLVYDVEYSIWITTCNGDVLVKNGIEITYSEFLEMMGESDPCADEEGNAQKSNLEKVQEFISKNGITDVYAFPKAQEGDFPDMSEFEGVEMEVSDNNKYFKKEKVRAKVADDGFLLTYVCYSYVRPIQKTDLTREIAIELLIKNKVDLSGYNIENLNQ